MGIITGSVAYVLYANEHVVSPLPPGIKSVLNIRTTSGEEELKRQLRTGNIQYSSVTSTQDGYIITLNPKQQIILGKKQDLSRQISSLQIILPRLTMEGTQFKTLDLRYNKPVVVY